MPQSDLIFDVGLHNGDDTAFYLGEYGDPGGMIWHDVHAKRDG